MYRTTLGGESMEIKYGEMELFDCAIEIILERYTRRNFQEDAEGDDMMDVGRMSYTFIIKGTVDMEEFKKLNSEANKKNNIFSFDLGLFTVVTKKLDYKTDGEFVLTLIEDTNPENLELD